MPRHPKSPHAHGPSEIWERPSVRRAVEVEQRLVGRRLRLFRMQCGLMIEEAAERIGIHPVHLQRIETGHANVTLATLVAITRAYGISLITLFLDDIAETEAAHAAHDGSKKSVRRKRRAPAKQPKRTRKAFRRKRR